ncbi:sirohydrochlorin chelatase [Parvibium lacunae]|uniref:Cobalamin biosynthesis protein CbiX n=1 Tax=Parvibium lacunae TaxID=1888893 RepID=A0A368KZE0_9BURK|nr:CbiX/SirB N-terminal domain-containing protein [Parvibium lacunae]RCS56464.1 cobalamin biosynthesis protein CbiX [Parvibium lacunae]
MLNTVSETGLLLFAHGARDARWAEPFERLQKKLAQQHAGPVRLCFLELMLPSLADAAQELVNMGCQRLLVVPIFLGRGGHIRRDLPRLIAELEESYAGVRITCADAAGENEGVLDALTAYCLEAARASL